MKKNSLAVFTIVLLITIIFSFQLQAQEDYYYKKGYKIYFKASIDRYVINFHKDTTPEAKQSFVSQNDLTTESKNLNSEYVIVESTTKSEIEVKELSTSSEVKIITNLYTAVNTNSEFTFATRFIVKFKKDISDAQIKELIKKYNLKEVKKDWLGERTYLFEVNTTDETNTLTTANQIYEDESVKFSHPDFICFNALESIPNDPLYQNQWNLSKISASQAWDITTGNSTIKIAILDTGVDSDHPDLIGKVHTGYNVLNPSQPPEPTPSADINYHGTGCAGIAAANTNNGIGIAGVGYNCRILPVKITHGYNIEDPIIISDAVAGINWARQNGADIISCSWECTDNDAVTIAINDAFLLGRNGNGCVVVNSAGNSTDPNPVNRVLTYPAYHPPVIAVGATNENDDRYYTSCIGKAIDVMAPSYVYTTDIAGSDGHNTGDYIAEFTGTSASAPHVSGMAGLLFSINSNLLFYDIDQIVKRTAFDIMDPGFDIFTGYGRINAYEALVSISSPYEFNRGNATLTKIEDNVQINFLDDPNPDVAHGRYWCEVWKIQAIVNFSQPYEQAPWGWLSQTGFSGDIQNTTEFYQYESSSTTSITLKTYFFYLKYSTEGREVNQWAPMNPNTLPIEYTVLGVPYTPPPPPPSPPQNLQMSGAEGDNPHLTWDVSQGADSYNVYRRRTYYNPNNLHIIGSTSNTYYTDNDIEITLKDDSDDNYLYRVTAVNTSGESDYSNYVETWGAMGYKRTVDQNLTAENLVDVPMKFSLNQNFPNPFNPVTLIDYEVPEDSYINLSVYNLKGQKVVQLVDRNVVAGFYQVLWDAKDQPSGIYICRMKADNFVDIKKLTLLK